MRQAYIPLFISVTCVGFAAGDVEGTDPNDVEQIWALAASYLANIESFSQLKCEYELLSYRPQSREELSRGTYKEDVFHGRLKPQATAEGVWVRSGSTVRREQIVDDAALDEALKTRRIVFSPERVLVDGVIGITFSKLLNGGVLYSRERPPEVPPIGPFDFGHFSGSERFWTPEIVLTDREHWKEGAVELLPGPPPNEPHAFQSDVPLVGFRYSLNKDPAKPFELQFWIDRSRGALPIIGIWYLKGRLVQKMVVTDVRTFPGGRAFPMRSIDILHSRDDESLIGWAVETRVRTLEVDSPIDPALLRIEVGDGAILRDAADDNSQFTLEKGGLIGISDIPALMERAAAQSRQVAEGDRENKRRATLPRAAEPPEKEGRSMLLYLNCGFILLLAAVLLVVRIRRRRRTACDP